MIYCPCHQLSSTFVRSAQTVWQGQLSAGAALIDNARLSVCVCARRGRQNKTLRGITLRGTHCALQLYSSRIFMYVSMVPDRTP
eukprot:COSAG06_NODE_188_length_20774_cov_9.720677_9_plen_84_part_00